MASTVAFISGLAIRDSRWVGGPSDFQRQQKACSSLVILCPRVIPFLWRRLWLEYPHQFYRISSARKVFDNLLRKHCQHLRTVSNKFATPTNTGN